MTTVYQHRKLHNSIRCYHVTVSFHCTVVPPNTAPLLTAPPKTAADFQVQNMFFLGYIISDSLNRRFQYRHYFAGPKSGGIGGWTVYPSLIKDKWIIVLHQYGTLPYGFVEVLICILKKPGVFSDSTKNIIT